MGRLFSRRAMAQGSLAALAAACASPGERGEDLLIHGGAIYTGDDRNPRVEAVRIRNGHFVFAGALADARAGSRGARVIDLRGAAAFPGFNDCHVHLTYVGYASMVLDLVGVDSILSLQQRLREYARAHPSGPIIGRGWIETHWPERRFPTLADLDAVVSDRPVFLERIDGHAAVVNTSALRLAGIGNATPNPEGGRIERDASGAPTGMLIDNAASLVQARFPAPTEAQRREALRQAGRIYAARGWTGVHNMSTAASEHIDYLELDRAGEMPLNAELYLAPPERYTDAERAWTAPHVRNGGFESAHVRLRGYKLYMDGALGSRGAALLAPYSDAPGDGLLVTPLEDVRGMLLHAREYGVQVATHAIGDRGNRLVLDLYAEVFADDPAALRAARWRIEHAQVISPADIPRFAAMGVIASMQPSHAISDLHFAPARLGPDRLDGAYAWRSLLNAGAQVCGGSDAPVERGDPRIEFYAAVYRHDLNGFAGPDWRLSEAVPRAAALRMFTTTAAYAAFHEGAAGLIAPGHRADLSVFSDDLMTIQARQIPDSRAVLTVSAGRVTHEAL